MDQRPNHAEEHTVPKTAMLVSTTPISVFLTSRLGALAGDVSVELPVRPAAHGGDPGQAAAVEEAAPGRQRGGRAWVSRTVIRLWEGGSGAHLSSWS